MSQPQVVASTQIATEAIIFPDENLWSNEPPLESDRHREQAVPQMLAMGLSVEQVAQVLNLSVEQVQQLNIR
ncbi:hypothetical protein ABN584_07245 [Gloeocapsa sp. BRSZ]